MLYKALGWRWSITAVKGSRVWLQHAVDRSIFCLAVLQSHQRAHYSRTARHAPEPAPSHLPRVALVGRPNVGKSALFNRLVGRRDALVWNTPHSHVTRDYKEAPASIADLRFLAVDTSGLEPFAANGSIQYRATELTTRVLRRADVVLLMLDGRSGILPADHALASWLRTQLGPPGLSNLVLVVNKCERKGRAQTAGVGDVLAEACALGLGEPLALSAHTGEGLVDLYGVLQPRMDALAEEQEENEGREEGEGGGEGGGEEEEEGEQGGEKGRGGDRGLHGNRTADVQSWAESTLHSRKKDNTTSTMHKDSTQRQSELSLEDQVARIIAGCADGVITDAAAAQLEGLDAAVGAAVGGIEGKGRVKMAVMGLPNAGKSTLTNLLTGEMRVMVGPEPGLTRDPITVTFEHQGAAFDLVDTPGWMRRSAYERFDDSHGAVAGASQLKGLHELNRCQVVVLLVDAQRLYTEHAAWHLRMLRRQELVLAQTATEEGRALVVALNKIDHVPAADWQPLLERARASVKAHVPQVHAPPVIGLSATEGRGVGRLLGSVQHVWECWNRRVFTAELNKWLGAAGDKYYNTPTGKQLDRIRYMTQVATRPPGFAVFMNGNDAPDGAFVRFLKSSLQQHFHFEGTPVRLSFRMKDGSRVRI